MTNAVEHGLAGGQGRVEVDAQRDIADDGRDTLLVTVGDDGTGMPVAFDPARAGLGTQIVQALVRELRGSIAWSSRPGGGTAVTLELHPRPVGPAQR